MGELLTRDRNPGLHALAHHSHTLQIAQGTIRKPTMKPLALMALLGLAGFGTAQASSTSYGCPGPDGIARMTNCNSNYSTPSEAAAQQPMDRTKQAPKNMRLSGTASSLHEQIRLQRTGTVNR